MVAQEWPDGDINGVAISHATSKADGSEVVVTTIGGLVMVTVTGEVAFDLPWFVGPIVRHASACAEPPGQLVACPAQ